ncbi:hypothetical protein O181_017294 [Austropuccinia psidii MF-1]|uniref:Integrase catalytic domain-containing protein n=1 Tax=Austropuccinia psidii MF-1 TaxID=1389203 RepID=A0A9Q3GSM1_9BASI|nr:hypothetical protein [Austropuccinia psidii MF-1]
MLGTEVAFCTACDLQTDGLAERMIQTIEEIIGRFCAYGIKYNDHEWVTLLQEIQLAYNTSQHSTTEKSSHYPPVTGALMEARVA